MRITVKKTFQKNLLNGQNDPLYFVANTRQFDKLSAVMQECRSVAITFEAIIFLAGNFCRKTKSTNLAKTAMLLRIKKFKK